MKKKVTEAELEVLKVLWEHGLQSVRFVNEELSKQREVVYTTTLKQMQVMVSKKGLLKRDTSQRTHLYEPLISQSEIQESMVEKMVDAVFQGSPLKLVVQALGHKKTSKQDLEAIKKIIQDLENNQHEHE